jgi:hypothetical protein
MAALDLGLEATPLVTTHQEALLAEAPVFGQSAAAGEALRQRMANDPGQIKLRAEAMQGKKPAKVHNYVPPAAGSQKPPTGPSAVKRMKGMK